MHLCVCATCTVVKGQLAVLSFCRVGSRDQTDLVASPLVSEPSYHPFLEFIELTLHVLEVSKDPNSRATPKEFSAAC